MNYCSLAANYMLFKVEQNNESTETTFRASFKVAFIKKIHFYF